MKKLTLVSALTLVLSACGGSNSSTPAQPDVAPKTITGTIDSVDPQHRSLVVNGHQYTVEQVSYSSANIELSALQPNMMIRIAPNTGVQRDSASGQAGTFSAQLEPTMTGVISNINPTDHAFSINGATLTFAELSPEIANGDWVMVSSLPTADAGYKVLSVVKFDDPDLVGHVEIEGRINSLDDNNGTFKLGAGITVNYDNGTFIKPHQPLENGQWVEIEGQFANNVFAASEIEIESYDDLDDDNEIEGIVTWVAGDKSQFELNYRGMFTVDAHTRFEDGHKGLLVAGAEVEVTTQSSTSNELLARVVEFDEQDHGSNWNDHEFECDGLVTLHDNEQRTMTMECSDDGVNLGEKIIYIDANTRFEHIQESELQGAYIEAEGIMLNQQYVAREIERDID
ncbi:TPA: hypothetical protein RQJ82_000086 [Vibrio vulnificus]|nr:hypothetical protein [Vibrio vulnificus]HDY7617921.1 hypothetical protein [Vibrio vulnificus]